MVARIRRTVCLLASQCLLLGQPATASKHLDIVEARPLLFLHEPEIRQTDSTIRLRSLLDGLGIPYHQQAVDYRSTVSLKKHHTIIVQPGFLQDTQDRAWLNKTLKSAIKDGSNILYIGSSFCGVADSELQYLFGVQLDPVSCVQVVTNQSVKAIDLSFQGVTGRLLPLYEGERIIKYDEPSLLTDSLVNTRLGDAATGDAVLVGFDLLSYWKHPESPSAYVRALLLTRLLNRMLTNGYVAKHASLAGLQSPILLRWEDVAPISGDDLQHPYIRGLDHFARLLQAYKLPVNIALVSRYLDPVNQILIRWSDRSQANLLLKAFVRKQIIAGGSIIAHGHTHQHGSGVDDKSTFDGEMWDEDRNIYLSFDEQRIKAQSAFRDISLDWDQSPLIWETPHYQSNRDTYKAVADVGYSFVVESDSSLFPNHYGYAQQLDKRLLLLPETGYEMPLLKGAIEDRLSLWRTSVQPDLYEIGAPFIFFYHGLSSLQLQGLDRLLSQSADYHYWKPSLMAYATFWKQRQNVNYNTFHDRRQSRFIVATQSAFKNFTFRVRLPNGQIPDAVSINQISQPLIARRFDHLWFVYIPVSTSKKKVSIVVSYRPAH